MHESNIKSFHVPNRRSHSMIRNIENDALYLSPRPDASRQMTICHEGDGRSMKYQRHRAREMPFNER